MLQQELLEQVLRLAGDPRTILNALAASKTLRLAAAQLIDCIVICDVVPPAHTWQTFLRATRIRIHRSPYGNEHLDFLRALLTSLPSHITALENVVISSSYCLSHEASLRFAQALVASVCCSNLLSVKLSSGLLTPAATDAILQGLPRLQEARLYISNYKAPAPGQHAWRPQAQSCQHLRLLDISYSGPGRLSLDLIGLSSATQLHCFSASNATSATSLAALQALTNLQHLDLSSAPCPAASWAVLAKLPKLDTINMQSLEMNASAPAAVVTRLRARTKVRLLHDEAQLPGCLARQLPQLQHLLRAPSVPLSAAAWALLVALPGLHKLEVRRVSVDAAAPAAASLSSLLCWELNLEHTAQQLRGCLAWQLPQLQHLRVSEANAMALAEALTGHQQLQQLCTEYYSHDSGSDAGMAHNVLADLASCSRLQELELACPAAVVTAAGLAALAAGACRETLRALRLGEAIVEPALLAPLLQPGMAALQQVVFVVSSGYEPAAVQQQVEEVLPAGGGWQLESEPWNITYRAAL
jgi:hypothetical protein